MVKHDLNIGRQILGLVVMALVLVVAFVLLFVIFPTVWQRWLLSSEQITVPGETTVGSSTASERSLKLVTLLGFDAIPAILEPSFVTPSEAEDWMDADEQVLGLSVNGEHRAYPIRMLSRHEIVNDVVGGVSAAVTW